MDWSDEGVVLGVLRHGDSSVVLEVLTRQHGRHLGLVRGGRSRALAPVLQPGNSVSVTWRARLEQHLGQFSVEPSVLRAAHLIAAAEPIFLLQVLAGHMHLLPEREPHPGLHASLEAALDALVDSAGRDVDAICAFLVRFELALLDELGFGLDLERCAQTGTRDDLVFVSPRSGRAVSRQAAAGYASRLLPLPRFIRDDGRSNRSPAEIVEGLRLTGHFLARDVYTPRGRALPGARDELIDRLGRPRRTA